VRYRVWQVFAGWRARLTPEAITEIRALLSPAELALFVAMLGRDQAHCLRVRDEVARMGVARRRSPSHPLLVSALLHDIGKGRVATWQRVAFVTLDVLAPRLARRIESPDGAGWRRALWRLRHHARLGAEQLAAIGADPRAVALVAGHMAPPSADADDELAWLIAADRVS
jgi:hypothetical protein